MTRRIDPGETLPLPDELESVARELQRYAALSAGETPSGLADRVMADLAGEPDPRRGLMAWLLRPFTTGTGNAIRVVMVAGTMVLAVLAVIVAGQLGDLLGDPQIGPSPSPPVIQTPTGTPTPTPGASQPPSDAPSVSPTLTPSPTSTTAPASSPSDHEDDGETPEPSDDDNSGPGGDGGSDDSG